LDDEERSATRRQTSGLLSYRGATRAGKRRRLNWIQIDYNKTTNDAHLSVGDSMARPTPDGVRSIFHSATGVSTGHSDHPARSLRVPHAVVASFENVSPAIRYRWHCGRTADWPPGQLTEGRRWTQRNELASSRRSAYDSAAAVSAAATAASGRSDGRRKAVGVHSYAVYR
jgi:hypothetical protein